MSRHLLSCDVWCSADDSARQLGLPDGDCWMPITINLRDITTIKLAGENDFIGDNKATVYVCGQSFIINKSYTEAVTLWANYLNDI